MTPCVVGEGSSPPQPSPAARASLEGAGTHIDESSNRRMRRRWLEAPLIHAAWVTMATSAFALPPSSPFTVEMHAAMTRMMSAMDVAPSGDVDRDFAAQMIPHHQGAIEMARAELRYGTNEQLRRLAQEIVVVQSQEIAVMKTATQRPALQNRGLMP